MAAKGQPMAQRTAPNIIIVTTDQQRTDSLGCYGSAFAHTPNLDKLAGQGTLFERAYCANSVCTPSRVSIFTGQKLARHGVWNVGLNTPTDTRMISHVLGERGYRTHYVGKAHFQYFGQGGEPSVESVRGWEAIYPGFVGPYYGFQTVELAPGHGTYGLTGHYGAWVAQQAAPERFAEYCRSQPRSPEFCGEARDWSIPTRLHNSTWTADRTIEFLRSREARQPFLLGVGFQDPHHPHGVPVDFADRCDPAAVGPGDYVEGELADKPPHFLEARHGRLEQSLIRGEYWVAGQGPGADFTRIAPADAALGRAYYFTLVRLIDQQMGRILHALEAAGLAENTIVVFTTDHGELLGDHGLWMKGPFHYEQLVRVPTLLRWPAGLPGGKRIPGILSHIDLAPTLLSAAGAHADADGLDLLPALRGERPWPRRSAVVELVDDPDKLRLKTLVTAGRKLTWYAGQEYGELYDLENDPGERINHWSDPTYAADKARLLGELLSECEGPEALRRVSRQCYA